MGAAKIIRNRGGAGVLRILAVLAAALLLLTGCGGAEEKKDEEYVELELMMHKREDMESMQKVVDAYHASQQKVRIRINMAPNVDMELKVRAAEGRLPDLIQLNGLQARETMEFVRGGYLEDLSKEPFMKQVREELVPYLRYGGEMPLFPMTLSYEGIFVNTAKLEQLGYEVPGTWEELIRTAGELEKRQETAFLFSDGDDWSIRMCWEGIETALRGSSVDFWEDVAEGRASFEEDGTTQRCLDMLRAIREYGQEDAEQTGYDEAVARFASGEGVFFPQGSWCYQALRRENPQLEVQLIPFPVPEGEKPNAVFWIDSNLAVSRQSEHKEEAKDFLEFLSDPQNIGIYESAQQAFGCLKGSRDSVEYARLLGERRGETAFGLEAVGLPREVARFREESVRSVLSDDPGTRQAYLEEYTAILRDCAQEYMEMKEKTG